MSELKEKKTILEEIKEIKTTKDEKLILYEDYFEHNVNDAKVDDVVNFLLNKGTLSKRKKRQLSYITFSETRRID